MDDRPVIVTPRRLVARSFAEFFVDLARGDLVAWTICLGLMLFFAIIAVMGAWFLYRRKQAQDAFKKKVAEKRKKEAGQYKASKKAKEI